ncbi:MAG: FtsX-like permease family protein [Bacteroidota bacterium]
MNLLKLSWKNLTYKPLSMLLSILLFALGVGLIALLFLLEDQVQKNFDKNLAGVDLVVGAKGSPLQLILSSMYHIDAPTGNITIKEARPFLNPKHPLIQKAIPLSMGDSYGGYRIVGTTPDILDFYEAQVATGEVWQHNFEVTLGARVAAERNLKLGDEFKSSHGFVDDEDLAHADAPSFKVVGILAENGTVLDQLILTTNQTYWMVHEHGGEGDETAHDHSEEEHAHDDHDHAAHDHGEHAHEHDAPKPLTAAADDKDITALLLKFKGRNFQALNLQRNINENTDMQAATPAIEINRLYALMNTGEQALRILAIVIIIVSGLSIFISLFSSLKERKYELALMRVMGATPSKLFSLIVLEGLILAFIGFLLGMLLSHGGMQIFAGALKEAYRYSFSGLTFLPQELLLFAGAIGIGFLAAVLPAIQASKTDISETLAEV